MIFKRINFTGAEDGGLRVATIGHGFRSCKELEDSSSVTIGDVELIDHGDEVVVDNKIYGLWEGSNGKQYIRTE